jgi:hypothetical protein
MADLKTYTNFYWSVRKYLYEGFLATPIYYNPLTKPSVSEDKVLLLYIQGHSAKRLVIADPRIVCVTFNDPEAVKLTELVSAVVERFDSPASGRKTIPFIDWVSKAQIGNIRVSDIRVRPMLPYAEGYLQRALDMSMDYVVESRHPFV